MKLPKKLANGNYPAIAYARTSLARKLIRDRRAANLSQAELARRAGISVEMLNHIERLKMSPSVAMVEKIDRALTNFHSRRKGASTRKVSKQETRLLEKVQRGLNQLDAGNCSVFDARKIIAEERRRVGHKKRDETSNRGPLGC
ncbi:MAG: helix-turn-helix transcriptional regulator [Tepidisphaeraceae bacterium]